MGHHVLTDLAKLRKGDIVLAVDGKTRQLPITVESELGPIEPGSPVNGVRFEKVRPDDIDMVFYPSQVNGLDIEIDRPEPSDTSRVAAIARLASARKQHPELGREEADARVDLAAAIIAMDEAADVPGHHNLVEQVAVEQAKDRYAQALANLIRGESS